jgi:hypothetical protein
VPSLRVRDGVSPDDDAAVSDNEQEGCMTRVVDAVGSAIVNAMDVYPPHDCGEFVDNEGRCAVCWLRARYVLTTLGTVGVEITQGRQC